MIDREKVIKDLEYLADWLHQELIAGARIKEQICLEARSLLKEQETANVYKCPNCGTWVSAENVVRCKDCDNKECYGRAGDVVCGIDGTPHRPDWYCADGGQRW